MTSITPVEENPLVPTEKTPILVHAVTTTQVVNTPDTTAATPAGPAPDKQEGSWLSKLFYRSSAAGPSLVVEVDDASNDASLKIMHLPLVRHQRNNTLITEVKEVTAELNNTSTHNKSKRQAPVNPRELKFRIFDRRVVQALINAYAPIDPYRASLMQANVHRLMIKIALDEEGEWLKHYGFALRDLPFVVHGGLPGAPIAPQRKRRSIPLGLLPTQEPVEVEPQEPVEVEPQEPVEVEPTEAVEVEPQEPVEVEPTEAAEVKPKKSVEGAKKAKAKRAVKNAKPAEVEPQEPVEVEPTEAVEVEPQEPVEVEPTEAVAPAEVEPQEPVEAAKKGKAKRAVKNAKPAEVEPQEPVEVEPTEAVEVEPQEPVQVEPTEAVEPAEVEPQEPVEAAKKGKAKRAVKNAKPAEVEPQEPVEVEPTEAVEVEPQEPVEVEPTEAVEPQEPVEAAKKGKAKRAVKNAKPADVEPQEPVEVEPQEPVEVEPTEAAEPAEVEPQEPVEAAKKGKAKRAVKNSKPAEVEPQEAVEVEPTEAAEPAEVEANKKGKGKANSAVKTKVVPKEAEIEPEAKEPEAEVKPCMKDAKRKSMQSKKKQENDEKQVSKENKSKQNEQEKSEKPKKKAEQEQVEQEQEPVEKEQKKKNKKQKRQAIEGQPQGEVETVTQTPVKPTTPVGQGGVTPFNPYACNALCQQQAALQPVCATNGFCVHEFPSPCSLKIYSCKHPQLGFQIMNQGQCIYTANVPRCIDLLVAS